MRHYLAAISTTTKMRPDSVLEAGTTGGISQKVPNCLSSHNNFQLHHKEQIPLAMRTNYHAHNRCMSSATAVTDGIWVETRMLANLPWVIEKGRE